MQGQAQARVTGILGAGLLVNHSPVWSFAWKPDLEKAWLLHAWGDRRAPKTRLLGPWQQNRKWQKMAVTWELLLRTPYAGMAGGHRHSPLLLAFPLHSSFFFRFYLFIFRERRKEGERGEKYQCVVASCAPPTGDPACNPGTYTNWESNQQPSDLQASTQSTEPQQPGFHSSFTSE